MPRSRPTSTIGPSTSRVLQGADVDYTSVPSPRINSGRLGFTPGPLVSNYPNRSPAYDRGSALGFSAHRPARTFGGISQQQDDEEDAEKIMSKYVDFDGGVPPYSDSGSPPPQEQSPPPQVSRKLVHSPVVNRSTAKQPEPVPVDRAVELSPAVTASRQAKGKQRATEEPEAQPPTPAPIKTNGKRHANLTDDEAEQDAPVLPRKPRSARVSNDSVAGAASAKGKAVRNPEPPEDVQPEPQYDEPQFDDNAGDDFGQDFEEDEPAPAVEEPPLSASEHSAEESEAVEKKVAKRPVKVKKATKQTNGSETEKKRRRKVDDDPPRQTKKAKADSEKPSSRARSKTPVEPDKSWLERMCP